MNKSPTGTGQAAESAVAEYLRGSGYSVLERNWRTRYCEIDIICQKDKIVYFVEVKYRAQQKQGSGFDYITASKLKQMHFAAEMWIAKNEWSGPSQLMAAEVSGPACEQIELVEI